MIKYSIFITFHARAWYFDRNMNLPDFPYFGA